MTFLKEKKKKKFPVFLLLRFSSVADHFRSAQHHQMHYDYIALKSSLIVIFLCRQSLQETVEFWTSTKFDHTGQRSCPHFHFDQRGLFGRLLKWGKKQQPAAAAELFVFTLVLLYSNWLVSSFTYLTVSCSGTLCVGVPNTITSLCNAGCRTTIEEPSKITCSR